MAKSSAHRWVARVELPISESRKEPFLSVDGTGFKRQPGQRGGVRLVLELGKNGELHPLGVWAGTSWEHIATEVQECLQGQAPLLISDGEQALERWFSRLTETQQRCHWHLIRDSGHMLWQHGVPIGQRRKYQKQLVELLALEIPEEDIELLHPEDREAFYHRI